jgi:hypothetical protein
VARRFDSKSGTAIRLIQKTLRDLNAKRFEIKHTYTEKKEAVAIMFTVVGSDKIEREYRFICDNYENPTDNLTAAQLTLQHWFKIIYDYRVRIEGQKSTVESLLGAFRVLPSQQILIKALPDPDRRTPNEVLGIAPDANRDEINRAFREKAKENHPDKGGDAESMIRVTKARDDMLARIS